MYHVDTDIDVHKFKIIDTIHIKRSQIEARLAEYSDNQKRHKPDQDEVLMLTYPGYDKLCVPSQDDVDKHEDHDDNKPATTADIVPGDDDDGLNDPNLDGLSLKDNTRKKLSQFTQHVNDADKVKKMKSPPLPKKKKYNTSVDWREELKNRDKAKQLEALKNYKIGTPDYKEPDKELEEKEKQLQQQQALLEKNKLEKSKTKWERIKLKPTNRGEVKQKEKEAAADEPFKINLRPVNERLKTGKNEEKSESVSCNNIQEKKSSETISRSSKTSSRRNSVQQQEEKIKPSKSKPKRQQQQQEQLSDDKKYVIKIINFVAIKVPIEASPVPQRRRNLERKPSQKKPPIPSTKPPSLPCEDDICTAEECETETFKLEMTQMLENDFDERLKTDLLRDILTEIIKDNELKKANVMKEKVQLCPKPKLPTKPKDEKSFDEKYFKPRRRKIIDYVPEPVQPLYRRNDDITIEPIKFSATSDNYVTKNLFVGSQYVGHKNLK